MKDHKFTGFQSLRLRDRGKFEGLGLQAAINVILRRKSADGGVHPIALEGLPEVNTDLGVCTRVNGKSSSSTFYVLTSTEPAHGENGDNPCFLTVNPVPVRRYSFGTQLAQSLDTDKPSCFLTKPNSDPATLQAHRSKSLSQIDCLHMAKQDSPSRPSDPSSAASPSADDRPKHRTSRKVPSYEFFSVSLEGCGDQDELVPAQNNVTLREAVQGVLERRNIDIDSVRLYLDGSNTPLSLQFDTYHLAGNRIVVRGKDSVYRTNSTGSTGRHHTKNNGSQRGRRGAVMVATEELPPLDTSPPGGTRSRPPNKRIFSNPFKTDKEKMDHLTELLNQYSQRGVPELMGLLTFPGCPRDSPDLFRLEEHWSHLVDGSQELSKRTKNQQDAIWELLQTEVFYIHRLKVITDLFLAVLCNLQNECLLTEVDTDKLFSNIRDIYHTNHSFWVDHLLPVLEEARRTRQPLNPLLMQEGFLKFDQLFQPYVRYCVEQGLCLQYVKERYKDNKLFKTYVAWCETRKDCDKLRLVDLLVKPMQRLTKYSLLLKAILKKTDDESLKNALIEMNLSVERFVCGVDGTLRTRHEQERLASIIGRIESYDAVDSPNDELDKILKDHCTLDLTRPMPGCGVQQSRHLLAEGSGLKLKDASTSKMDVHVFLFTDMLLICKAARKGGDKVRVVRQPYLVEGLLVQELRDGSGLLCVYLNEFQVATAAFVLYTPETRHWADSIRKAQELYRDARHRRQEEPLGGFLREEEDEELDYPSIALLVASKSPCSSSHSSLVHSHSGSMDMSDTVPVIAPPPKNLNSRLSPTKPPLVKTKPSGAGDDEAAESRAAGSKRPCRVGDRRYHTADSIENLRGSKDNSIHKRLSWNCGQTANRHLAHCLSSESVVSSSGVSSLGSAPSAEETDPLEEPPNGGERLVGPPGSRIKIDVSEVKDGISSVQIVSDPAAPRPTKADLRRMKEFFLTSCSLESSEV